MSKVASWFRNNSPKICTNSHPQDFNDLYFLFLTPFYFFHIFTFIDEKQNDPG